MLSGVKLSPPSVCHGTRTVRIQAKDYTAVSKQLVQKYPVLKDSYGNGYVSACVHMCVWACVGRYSVLNASLYCM